MPLKGMKPTSRQLAYLRALAERAGMTFPMPRSAAAASAEIKRLRSARPENRADRARELKALRRDLQERSGDAASVRAAEITGYGSSATWKRAGRSERQPRRAEPPRMAPAHQPVPGEKPPTQAQMRYLRHLASRAGVTLAASYTRASASEAIRKLRDQRTATREPSAAPQPSGGGERSVEPQHAGAERLRLADYRVGDEQRELIARPRGEVVVLSDEVIGRPGPHYPIGRVRSLSGARHLAALYIAEAAETGRVPMQSRLGPTYDRHEPDGELTAAQRAHLIESRRANERALARLVEHERAVALAHARAGVVRAAAEPSACHRNVIVDELAQRRPDISGRHL